jgi:hypothetical protein
VSAVVVALLLDAILMAERLLAWSDNQIKEDLESYEDVEPADACRARDLLLKWLKESASGKGDV